jgi:uncharacterized protein (TIGR02246 family)
MPEDKKAGIIRDFTKATNTGDVEKVLPYFTEDAVWVDPSGIYKGKEGIKSRFVAGSKNMKDTSVAETGNGIIVQGDKAFFEYVASATVRGKKTEIPMMCAFEFSGDKIKAMRHICDRLLIAQQIVSGWPIKSLVNMVVKQAEKATK